MKHSFLSFPFLILATIFPATLDAQRKIILTLDEAIAIAQAQSISAMLAKNNFLSDYWNFRAFKAEQLPSLNLSMNAVNFNRSLKQLQTPSGEINYIENYNMTNSMTLSIDQNITATGGTLSLYSNLERLDQYDPTRKTSYYAQPISLSYLQPLWSYNRFKWDKKVEPKRFEQSKRIYLEDMEAITVKTVTLFFDMLLQKQNCDIAATNYQNTKTMYNIASQRFRLGSVQKNELLQLELRMVNDSLAINNSELLFRSKKNALQSYLGYNESVELELIMPTDVPDLKLDYMQVLEKAIQNSSFIQEQEILKLEAERQIAMAKANRGISIQFNAQFGLSQSADDIIWDSYRQLLDQEIVGLSLKIPSMDWGLGKGRVMMAKAQAETVRNQIEQAIIDYRQDIYTQVLQFNSQYDQYQLSERANKIANERYSITLENFATGSVSVTDLNTSQSEKDEANQTYVNELYNFWLYYYQLRQITLYDYISGTDISAEFDKLIN